MFSVDHKLTIHHAEENTGSGCEGTTGDQAVPATKSSRLDTLGLDSQGLTMLQGSCVPIQLIDSENHLIWKSNGSRENYKISHHIVLKGLP